MTDKTAIIALSDAGIGQAYILCHELGNSTLYSTREGHENVVHIQSLTGSMHELWYQNRTLVFVGALGVCVRAIAPFLNDKKTDPAVVNIDVRGQFVQSVVSGHVGGANELATRIARITGGQAVLSTTSDVQGLWPLDCLDKRYGWKLECHQSLTANISAFTNGQPCALLLEARDQGTAYLEKSCPSHVDIYFSYDSIDFAAYSLLIAVTPNIYNPPIGAIFYRPPMLAVGVGCRKGIDSAGCVAQIKKALSDHGLALASVEGLYSVSLKENEPALLHFSQSEHIPFAVFQPEGLAEVQVPNPSEKVFETIGCYGVAEASALCASGADTLLVEKQKYSVGTANDLTIAIAVQPECERSAFVHIVGAGPGDPELVSVRGKRLLEQADLVLYAGSLVPEKLTHYAKQGATVLSSAGMNLEEQIDCMAEFYRRGLLIVRLHTGDPCLYGAIQEQMSRLDELGMRYAITPGISAFQAAAAQLKSQFTVPDRVQSIILTRGEGRTPMPEKEQLSKLAQSQSTMCIYLSATLVDQVQADLLEHYPQDTPVAVCHKLTWPEEKIWRGTLGNLARIVKENKLTLTTLLVVGEAIDARGHYSKLYDRHFSHGTRKATD